MVLVKIVLNTLGHKTIEKNAELICVLNGKYSLVMVPAEIVL